MTEKEQILQQLRNIISDAIRKINLEGQGMGLDAAKAYLEVAQAEVRKKLTALHKEVEDDNR